MSSVIQVNDLNIELKKTMNVITTRLEYNLQRAAGDIDNIQFFYDTVITCISSYAKVISSLGISDKVEFKLLTDTKVKATALYHNARQLAIMNEDIV
jgi:hypothetical protein